MLCPSPKNLSLCLSLSPPPSVCTALCPRIAIWVQHERHTSVGCPPKLRPSSVSARVIVRPEQEPPTAPLPSEPILHRTTRRRLGEREYTYSCMWMRASPTLTSPTTIFPYHTHYRSRSHKLFQLFKQKGHGRHNVCCS